MDALVKHASALAELNGHFLGMPPVAALQPEILEWHDGLLRLRAPLAANVNDKGCAFGGSMVSLMTIAAWGLVSLVLADAGASAEVYVADSQVRYLKPVFQDIEVEAKFDDDGDRLTLAETLTRQGRAGARLRVRTLLVDGAVAATFSGRFVAIGKS
ncbi:MAG: YiiD C-terminal domain-containing protein [Proteobacteria bacterium]|nr:YiiD C-terminal domain-containing protein [Pseudomonadota bacterium]